MAKGKVRVRVKYANNLNTPANTVRAFPLLGWGGYGGMSRMSPKNREQA